MKLNRPLLTLVLLLVGTALSMAQDETVNGNLTVYGHLKVDGRTANRQSFTLNGDSSTYYPVLFSDPSWDYGEFDLQIYRPNVHTNSSWQGSLMSRFRSHSSSWGHGAAFVESSVRQSSTKHLADFKVAYYKRGVVVWLKGQSTYYYHANAGKPTLTYTDSGDGYLLIQEYQGQVVESYTARSDVNSAMLNNGSSVGDNFMVGKRLGIGVVPSSHELEVNGTIRSKEVIVESTGWPDYVFEDGYALPSLEEVQTHIEEKGRLPGIAPAASVNTDGQSLGAMQREMMRKIEELTLYVIGLKGENDSLRELNEAMAARLEKVEGELEEGK